jgi:hypothetical protein
MHSTLNVQEVFVPRVALPLLPHENPPFVVVSELIPSYFVPQGNSYWRLSDRSN